MSTNNTGDRSPAEPKSTKKRRNKPAKDKAKVVSSTSEQPPISTTPAEDGESGTDEANHDTLRNPRVALPEDMAVTPLTNGTQEASMAHSVEDPDSRFETLVKDRDALRVQVTQLRQSLEELQASHQTNLDSISEKLEETQTEKEHAEDQYHTLLGRVNTIKAQLGERLKADAEELAQARSRIEQLEEQNASLRQQQSTQSAALENLKSDIQAQSKELLSLRNRANLSQQNWLKEREDLVQQEAYSREQFQNAEQAMREWEVLALEERSIRKDLGDRVSDLEEQLSGLKEAYEKAASERDTQSNTVDGLQMALQEIQTARKQELRDLVESSQSEANNLRSKLAEAQKTSALAVAELETMKKELERTLPFEKEVKEKNLLIGKLRHEAVTLNEHLTKALRFLKRGKPEDNVDRQIVTNHLLHFLALDRSDPKKFQILQLIGALLGWTDEQREQAGLSRPGTTTTAAATTNAGGGGGGTTSPSISGFGSLRLTSSPAVHRIPSTPVLSGGHFPDAAAATRVGSPASRESLAELWQSFLEQESGAAAAAAATSAASAASAAATAATSATTATTTTVAKGKG